MISLRPQDSVSQRLSAYAQKLETGANQWNSIDSSLRGAQSSIDSAEFDFYQAENSQRRASFDNGRTDSSWHGRDLQRQFRQGGSSIDRSESYVQHGDRQLDGLNSGVAEAQSGLAELAKELQAANDARLQVVEQALSDIGKAQGNFSGVDGEFQRFGNSGRWVDNAIFRADQPIWGIIQDRPGVDVRHHAFRVGDSLRDITREMQNMEWSLRDADRQGDQGQFSLNAAASRLRNAVGGPAEVSE